MAKAKPVRGIDLDAPLLANADRMISARLQELCVWERFLDDPARVYELHQARIAAKRLRYTLEIFEEVYSRQAASASAFKAILTEIRSLQDLLGEIHDADVLVPQLTAHMARLLRPGYESDDRDRPVVGVHQIDFDACVGLLTLCREARATRDQRYAQFIAAWQRLRAEKVFEALPALLEAAGTPSAATPSPHGKEAGSEENAYAEKSQAGDPDRDRSVSGRKRRGARNLVAQNGARHSGARADSGSGSSEGGAG